MPRRSLRPHLNQIRAWVRQGRTDAWVAHQLEVTVRDIEQFKRQNELVSDGDPADGAVAADYEEIDLRAEDDAQIAAELEAAELEAERAKAEAEAKGEEEDTEDAEGSEEAEGAPRTRRRSRRGGRGRSRAGARNAGPLEGTFDHGEEGYGLWLDPAVQDNPIYAEHWAGHRPVEVTVEEDRIVIRRVDTDD
ncbi:MAG TPA: hypothetical protein VGL68_07030 [Solirubrobacteraceae bacterium]